MQVSYLERTVMAWKQIGSGPLYIWNIPFVCSLAVTVLRPIWRRCMALRFDPWILAVLHSWYNSNGYNHGDGRSSRMAKFQCHSVPCSSQHRKGWTAGRSGMYRDRGHHRHCGTTSLIQYKHGCVCYYTYLALLLRPFMVIMRFPPYYSLTYLLVIALPPT
jgi:hypothetical protein